MPMIRDYPIDRVLKPLDRFIRDQTMAGVALFVSAAVAVVLANSPWREAYHAFWEHTVAFHYDDFSMSLNLKHVINDGLMAGFFFLVALELKRSFIAGDLSSPKAAALPLAASFGGMAFPALIFLAINQFEFPAARGWGITLGTDTAFVLVILGLLGKRVPPAVKAFFIAVSVIDDIVSVSVIALFYTSDLSTINLVMGGIFLAVMVLMNVLGVRNMTAFAVVGILGMWSAFMLSGVHATVAGVLGALAIPATVRMDGGSFVNQMRHLANEFDKTLVPGRRFINEEQVLIITRMKRCSANVEPPLQRLEHRLHPWVSFLVLPLFALANAGIELPTSISAISSPLTMGVSLGLLLGKPIGLLLMSWIFLKLGWGTLGAGVRWPHMVAVSVISGLGFTMALFISELAYTEEWMRADAKLGILVASLTAGFLGTFLFLRAKPEVAQGLPR